MSIKVNFQKVAMGIEEGVVLGWRKAEGERVEAGELLVEIETAKVVQEIEAPAGGVLARILVPEGETIEVNTILALIED
jgi:pyruvate/2-oxoglutarate dehydrogenase complex dihydrolipoamide acyltransferase (E2) component